MQRCTVQSTPSIDILWTHINEVLYYVSESTKSGIIERGWISLRRVKRGHGKGVWVVDIVQSKPGREVRLGVKKTFHLIFEI